MTARSEDALATVCSLNSDHSTEQLIADPLPPCGDSAATRRGARRLVVPLGGALALAGALLAGAGALALVKGSALARVAAGLWAGGAAVVAGAVGVLAGIGDCSAPNNARSSNPGALSAFVALALVALGGAQAAAALSAAGLQRDVHRPATLTASFQEEMRAWWPVLANACVLCAALVQMVLSAAAAWVAARHSCSCWRPKEPYDLNQFEPGKDCTDSASKEPTLAVVDEASARQVARHITASRTNTNHKECGAEWGSANSRSRLVSRWLVAGPRPHGPGGGVRKARPAPLMLLPARVPPPPRANTTLTGPAGRCMVLGGRYATLPLPPAPYPVHRPHLQPLYYPVHDARMRRRRSPRGGGGGGVQGRRRAQRGPPGTHLTRSLERIQRRQDRQRDAEADLKTTYTGLDRAYAEQYIAVCDESRHATDHPDSWPASSCDTSHS